LREGTGTRLEAHRAIAYYDPRLTRAGFWRLRALRLIVGDRALNPRHRHRGGALDGCGLRVERYDQRYYRAQPRCRVHLWLHVDSSLLRGSP
jgi:hypothetical protein